MKKLKVALYVILALGILFNIVVLFLFHEDQTGNYYFVMTDPETGREVAVKNCEEIHGFEILFRDCINWERDKK